MNDKEWYAIGIDTSDFYKQAKQTKREFTSIGNTAYNAGMKVDRSFQMIGKGALAYLSVRQLAQYSNAIIQIRGEFQQLGIAFETMLGSKAQADKLMAETVTFAQKTPFTLTDVASNIKQLMAMGIATEDVMDTMKALGDVAAGVSVPISRIAVNYGQVATLGKLQSRELKDFAMAGIPLVDELAKNLGKTKNEIQDLISAGRVGFPEVEKAFQTMASEGGKFYNLMEKQNASVTGQISNLQDKIEVMMNQIGESNEGLIYSGIEGVSYLVDNYEEIGKVLTGLVVTYGTYKAALMTVAALEGVVASSKTALLYLEMSRGLGQVTLAHRARAVAMGIETKAQAALNAVMAVNPYVLLTTVAVGAAAAIWVLHDSTTAAEKAQKRYNEELEKTKEAKEKLTSKTNALISAIKDETKSNYERLKSYRDLQREYPRLFKDMDVAEFKAIPDQELKFKINVERDDKELKELENDYKATLNRINDLEEQYNSMSLKSDRYGTYLIRLQQKITLEKEYLKKQEKEIENAKKIRKEAEFEAKPTNEKLDYYNKELESLKQQRAEIEKTLLKSEEINGQWGQFGVQTIINTGKLDDINTKIEETAGKIGKLTGQAPAVENKAYWETQRKEAKEALEAMTAAQEGTKDWNENIDKLNEAQSKLKLYDFTPQVEKYAEQLQKQLREALANKLGITIDVEPTLQIKKDKLEALKNELSALTDESKDGSPNLERRLYITKEISKLESEINNTTIKGRKAKIDVTKVTHKQLKPMKQLTEEEIKRLEVQSQQIDSLQLQQGIYLDLAEGINKSTELLGAFGFAVGELDNDLGRTINQMADLAFNASALFGNLGTGNMLGAVTSGLGFLGNVFALFKDDEDHTVTALEAINRSLETQSSILASLTGESWFSLMSKQASDYKTKIDESTDSLRNLNLLTKEENDLMREAWRQHQESYPYWTGSGPISWSDFKDLKGYVSETSGWDIDQFIKAWGNGEIALSEEAQEYINNAVEAQKGLDNLYADLTLLTGESMADSIIQGFKEGKTAAADFADNFEDMMTNAILNSIKMQFLTPLLQAWNEDLYNYMNDQDGLTEDEIKALRQKYQNIIDTGYAQVEALEKITGLDLTGNTDTGGYSEAQGISRSLTEETGSLIVGQFYSMRLSLKEIEKNTGYNYKLESIDENTRQATDYLMQSVALQQEIADNTSHNVRINDLIDKVEETNKILKEGLTQ
nr:tape measure protein [uncultured Draconibacterium sp.]